jgi:hypothetical protein
MENPSNKAKQQWNASHYAQVKVSVKPELASAFKNACVAANASMTSVLAQFMTEYCTGKVRTNAAPDYTERRKRAVAVKRLVRQLSLIMSAEACYMESIPENLQGSLLYERAEQTVSVLEEAIDLLETAY